MNDLVVLSLNLSHQAVAAPNPAVPGHSFHSAGQGQFDGSGQFQQQHLPPPPYAPELINPNIYYPGLVGGAAGVNTLYAPLPANLGGAATSPSGLQPIPSAYQTVTSTYESNAAAGIPTVGTQVSFEV